MTDNPYINKQNWGRDLLDRLNNFSNEDGSFNVVNALPTQGKDGVLLGSQHTGYTVILTSGESQTIYTWDGSKWNKILNVPFSVENDSSNESSLETTTFSAISGSATIHRTSIKSDFYYLIVTGSSTTIACYSVPTHTLVWSSSLTFVSGQTVSTFAVILAEDETSLYVLTGISHFAAYKVNKASGQTIWTTNLGTSTRYVNTLPGVRALNSIYFFDRYSVGVSTLHELNELNGTVRTLNTNPVTSTTEAKALLYDPTSSSNLFACHFGISSIRIDEINLSSLTVLRSFNFSNTNEYSPKIFAIGSGNIFNCRVIDNSQIQIMRTNASTGVTSNFTLNLSESKKILNLDINSFFVSGFKCQNINEFEVLLGSSRYYLLVKLDLLSLTCTISSFLSIVPESAKTSMSLFSVSDINLNSFGSNYLDNFYYLVSGTKNYALGGYSLTLSSSQKFAKLTQLKSSYFSMNEQLASSDFNVFSIKAFEIESANLRLSKQLILPFNESSIANGGKREPTYNYTFGNDYLNFFSFADGVNANFTSASYTGGKTIPSGFVWWSTFGNGSLSALHLGVRPAIFCYDAGISKFFMEVAGTAGSAANFPSGQGFVLSLNNVGIGTDIPAFKVDVVGTLRATEIRNSGGVITSDPRLKLNMTSLSGLDLWDVCQLLNPITFVYKPDFEVEIQEISKDEGGNDVVNTTKSKWPLPQGIQYGYNALEVEELLPELVDEDPRGIKYLNAGALFPIFQAAATSKIQSLESEVESLKQLVQSLITRIEVLENA